VAKPQQEPGRLQQLLGNQKLIGADVKAWFANGLEELRSVFVPNTTGPQLGNIPGTMLTPTTGEQTADRMGRTMDVPGKMSLDDLRGYAQDRAKEAEKQMDTQFQARGPEMGM
jgi:hypothetical protein